MTKYAKGEPGYLPVFAVYTASNCEECFFCAAFSSEEEAKRWVKNVKRRGHTPELFIVEQSLDDPIEPEVK